MPDQVVNELWLLIPTVVYFLVGLALFGVGIFAMDKFAPFSIQKEIEEDHNVALGIIMAGVIIGLSIILAAAIQ